MAYTAPRTWVTGEIVTAALLNTHLRDNVVDLDRRTSPVTAYIAGPGTTSSQTPGNMNIGAGPVVTVIIGATGKAQVTVSAAVSNSGIGGVAFLGYALSGANTRASSVSRAFAFTSPTAGGGLRAGVTFPESALIAGSTTFSCQEWVDTNGGTASYSDLRITVTPLGS